MEIAIGFCIGIIIALAFGRKGRRRQGELLSRSSDAQAEHERLSQNDEELITTILPTINHDK
jgi:hypothetical protein